jgi:hypothetical protein
MMAVKRAEETGERWPWRSLAAMVLAFLALQVVLFWLVDDPKYWGAGYKPMWLGIAALMQEHGIFNVWSGYPPLFPTLFYAAYRLAGGDGETTWLIYQAFNLALIVLTTFAVYKIVRRSAAVQPAILSAAGYLLVNLGWRSRLSIGLSEEMFNYLPVCLSAWAFLWLLEKRVFPSAIACGLGVAAKVYPALLLLPVYLSLDLRRAMRYLIYVAVVCLAVFGPFFAANPPIFLSAYYWNSAVGAYESPYTFPQKVVPPGPEFFEMTQVVPPGKVESPLLTVISFAALGLLLWLMRGRVRSDLDLLDSALLTLLVYLLLSRGFSSYYILWLMPFISARYLGWRGFMLNAVLLLVGNARLSAIWLFWPSIFARHILLALMAARLLYLWARRQGTASLQVIGNEICKRQ